MEEKIISGAEETTAPSNFIHDFIDIITFRPVSRLSPTAIFT